ncbi:AMP-binding protein [Novosphingobium pokkalii]|uniref:AMP-binding protein n=1 Tax=Novosphingobium pokkalii TaxID=1770194 RepID=A0ABV7V3M5_9SPHN|nr:AMP-binding protein [Novosphingobium pokkalii]GHC90551.1 acyl-CoA synthetase [Novosphingobium pokkalii]
MFHPRAHAQATPEKAACVFADATAGQAPVLNYAALESAANRGAQALRRLGLARGEGMALMLDNTAEVFTIGWAAERAGLYCTSISTRLSPADAAYIVADSGARVLVVSDRLAPLASRIAQALAAQGHTGATVMLAGAGEAGLPGWAPLVAAMPDAPIADESPGTDMLYSSGTTGRPKGVKPALPTGALGDPTPLLRMGQALYGMDGDTVYLSTSPLYHAAPLRWAMTIQRLGGTVVVMDKFDAQSALALVARWRVTHGTWVPTHFVRLLKLDPDQRAAHDLSSMRAAIHAGAPCPVAVKQAMIDWWGPIVHEYYSGTEMCGITALSAHEWLAHPGSVGRAVLGDVHILDDNGEELPTGTPGNVHFANGPAFAYHNDPAKTAAALSPQGWATLGDIGYLDAEGFLYLTDRKHFMIISGGVNIYPQEIENHLITHPAVADVAVVGAPDADLGEVAVAVIQPAPGVAADEALAARLIAETRAALGPIKTPKRVLFRSALPREPTGKLLKASLIAELREAAPVG